MRPKKGKPWRCPKCGATGEDIQGLEPEMKQLEDRFGNTYYLAVPTKIWCMKCGKEYPASQPFVFR